jgi:hypothetical protein
MQGDPEIRRRARGPERIVRLDYVRNEIARLRGQIRIIGTSASDQFYFDHSDSNDAATLQHTYGDNLDTTFISPT